MDRYVRLPLKNASNVRELGGYASLTGKLTTFGYLLRADDLSKLDKDDIQFLLNYGITSVIDLRSDSELKNFPDPFEKIERINYKHIPLIEQDVIDPNFYKELMKNPSSFLTEMYLDMIKNATIGITKVFEFIANQDDGVLFHCTAGKDRTGIIAMLLLGLAGVSKEDIVTNYMVTEIYIRKTMLELENVNEFPKELGMSKAEYIEPVIDYIVYTFNGFEEYLLFIGIDSEVLKKIKEKMLMNELRVEMR